MEQTNLPSTSSAQISLPASSLSSPDKIARAIQSFGDEYREMVFCKYQKPMGITKAVSEKAPTFHDVTDFFGEESTRFWLRFNIAETFAFLGIYDTASKYQVQHTADLIMQHEIYGQLTLSEFLCFLQRFKMGSYGKIYQSNHPNPQEFLACLRPFWNELSEERGKLIEKERQEKISRERHDPTNITYEEWCKLRGKEIENNPLQQKAKEVCQKNNTPNNEPSLSTSSGSSNPNASISQPVQESARLQTSTTNNEE